MYPLTFNVGPSKLFPETRQDIAHLAQSAIPEMSHRSKEFSQINQAAVEGLRDFFSVPSDYSIIFTSSAHDAWELAIASCVETKSFHFVQGFFSKKFADVAQIMGKTVHVNEVSWGEQNDYTSVKIPHNSEMIAITHNETSTGVMCTEKDIAIVRERYPEHYIVVDSTSIAGIVSMPIALADVWLFSVQKCFGLPAGLGILIVHDRVAKRAQDLAKRYPSRMLNLPHRIEQLKDNYNTIETPNVMTIYLLAKLITRWNAEGGLAQRIKIANEHYTQFENIINELPDWNYFVKEPRYRSRSVLCIQGLPENITAFHTQAQKHNIILGQGYGKLKSSTIRLANFPAINANDIAKLAKVWLEFANQSKTA